MLNAADPTASQPRTLMIIMWITLLSRLIVRGHNDNNLTYGGQNNFLSHSKSIDWSLVGEFSVPVFPDL